MISRIARLFSLIVVIFSAEGLRAAKEPTLRVLFLGDQGHHRPSDRFKQLAPEMRQRQIELVYTEDLKDLNAAKLAGFDCLLIYANHTRIAPEQEKALLDFVERGGGFVPLHCASFCFLNSPKYIELVGAQFKSHGTGVFKETIVAPDHPVMKGLAPIESWDESYVHIRHNSNRTVLAERRDEKGAEPYTWVRNVGRGRVFYTAWGHDQRTWSNPNFVALVENGIRWASENSPTQLKAKTGLKPFEYVESPAPLPNYTPNAAWGTQSEPIRTMQKPLSPAESMQHLATHPGFQVSLFASEPQVTKPIWLSWDERGRLWIAETVDYPNNLQPEGEGHDRIKICEDTDGDGVADKFTIFCDKLSIPTSFVFANGGVIVTHSGRAEFFKDTDGDDKADERKVLFSGWGMRDTHATVNNLRYGFDGWIWGTVGYSGFEGTVGGKHLRFGQGIFRFKPDGSELEYVRASNNNTWGLGITEDNIVIGSTANGNASMYMPIPNRYYEAVNGWSAARIETIADSQNFYPLTDKVRQVDFHGRYTAGSGSGIYTARAFPREYWNSVQFVAEPTGHLLGNFYLERRGADFIAHNARNFAASDDEWTAPIYGEVGPDGAVWLVDWYNYVIQHNPTPRGFQTGKGAAYETPLRDKEHGRIYRITYQSDVEVADGVRAVNGYVRNSPVALHRLPRPLDKGDPGALVERLKDSNLFWRITAQRLLIERNQLDAELEKSLVALVRDQTLDGIGLNPGAIHALWTLKALGGLSSAEKPGHIAAREAFNHPSAAVRRAAAMVLRDRVSADTFLPLLGDPDAQVRMAALLAISEMQPSDSVGPELVIMLQQPQNWEDRWIPDAITCAAAKNDAQFIRAVLANSKSLSEGGTASNPASAKPKNLISNSSFEAQSEGKPDGWRATVHNGRGEFKSADLPHSGSRSVRISSSEGGDLSWAAQVNVTPRTDYKLTGWIRTENLQKIGGARGALFNIHELQDPVRGATKAIFGDNDWTKLELTFNSGELRELTVNCLFGGWGRATGSAWFDDLELTPAGGSELAGETGRVLRLVTAHYAQRGPVESVVPTLLALKEASPAVATTVLDGLMTGWADDKTPSLSDAEKKALQGLMESLPESSRDRLLALAQKWGQPDLFGKSIAAIIETLKKSIADSSEADDKRAAAAKRLVGLQDNPETVDLVLKQVNTLSAPALASGLVNALSESRAAATGNALIDHWSKLSPAVRRNALAVLLRRGEWSMELLDAVEKHKLSKGDLAAEHWSNLKQNPNRAVARRAERLAEVNATVSSDREEVVKKLLPLAKEKGDPKHGKEVFTATCAVCHSFNGEGGKVGPDLSGIGARDRSEILTDILDPNRSVEANYRMWNVTSKDGDTFSGRLESETQTSVEILDTAGQKHVVQRKDIASIQGLQTSIMPVGFEALPPDDLKALLEYICTTHQ